jgi:diaminopimelate decarboxylase
MNNFHLVGEEMWCEDVPLSSIARDVGTPAYVYSKASIVNSIELLAGAFESLNVRTCFSIKSNSNLGILRVIAGKGLGADVVSGGELYRAFAAGFDPKKIVFSGVGKTDAEIRYAIEKGIGMFNIESEAELAAVSGIAESMDAIAPISFRVNPDIDARTHHFTTTAKKENKFGIPMEEAADMYRKAHAMPHVNPIGIAVHLGSPLLSLDPYRLALEKLSELYGALHGMGVAVHTIDLGGGFGIVYKDEKPFTPIQFAGVLAPYAEKLACDFVVEPGRFIVGNAGILLTRVTYVKQTPSKLFYICDAGMNDLIRPPLYDAYHEVLPVIRRESAEKVRADIVGPVCESSDYFALGREIDRLARGDLVAVRGAGAYGFSMSSNYNSRPRPCEVLVDGKTFAIIRKRESYTDIVRGEE